MNILCKHWRDCGEEGGGCCAISAFGDNKTISFGICLKHCDQYDGLARGRGDVVHKVIQAVTMGTIKPCGGCKERRRDMNAKHPSLVGVGS